MTQWKIDAAHSEIVFKVKHLVVSTVSGHFDRFDARIETASPDFSDMRIMFEADVDSINTKNTQRDGHLKSPDFFDAANHPKLSFASKSVKKLSDHELEVAGDLTIRGVTKPVTLEVIYNGTVAGFGGARVAGFEVRGKVNRFDCLNSTKPPYQKRGGNAKNSFLSLHHDIIFLYNEFEKPGLFHTGWGVFHVPSLNLAARSGHG